MKIVPCEEPDKCEIIWRKFVKPQTVWDLWEIRKIFLDVYGYPIKFVVAIDNDGKIAGALPLWRNTEEKRWEWISDQWAEGNFPLTDNPKLVAEMLSTLPGKIFLDAIRKDKVHLFGQQAERDSDHFGFSIKARGGDWAGVLASMPARKDNVKRNIKAVEKMNPKVVWDREADLGDLFLLNIFRMRQKAAKYEDEEISVYENGKRNQQVIVEMWRRGRKGPYRSRILAVEVNGRVAGVMFNLIYKDKYVQLHRGEDVVAADGIGSYMNMLVVEDAKKMGCDYVDFCMEEHHWKNNWCLAEPTYKINLTNPTTKRKERDESFSYL